jgi:hypothetical protein
MSVSHSPEAVAEQVPDSEVPPADLSWRVPKGEEAEHGPGFHVDGLGGIIVRAPPSRMRY